MHVKIATDCDSVDVVLLRVGSVYIVVVSALGSAEMGRAKYLSLLLLNQLDGVNFTNLNLSQHKVYVYKSDSWSLT